ncbi:hypothetical protein [Bacillus swezeyi]|uniref:hypothetical protein n=1 Tax=Bacillus swezeyi TaxID=1925020 RepID=UPI001CC26561|nr:hypothetical protein [Bacillus swezeyi]
MKKIVLTLLSLSLLVTLFFMNEGQVTQAKESTTTAVQKSSIKGLDKIVDRYGKKTFNGSRNTRIL